jgi:hypothetical protein
MLTVTDNSTIAANLARGAGGGVYNNSGMVTVW